MPDLRPLGAGEVLQGRGDRGGGPGAVVEPAVAVEQLHAMAEQGLLTPQQAGGSVQFRRAELLAARELGG